MTANEITEKMLGRQVECDIGRGEIHRLSKNEKFPVVVKNSGHQFVIPANMTVEVTEATIE